MSTDTEREKAARRRREKAQLSCNLCRKRKLRCNRIQPCWNCSSRGLGSSCTFPENSNVPAAPPAPAGASKATSFQDRINHLESLVVQLLKQDQPTDTPHLCSKCSEPLNGTSQSPSPPEVAVTTTAATATISSPRSIAHVLDVGKLQIDSAKSAYVSSPHWSAVLNGLSELRSLWPTAEDRDYDGYDGDEFFPGDQTNNQYYKAEPSDSESPMSIPSEAPPERRRFRLLFGGHRLMTLDEILQAMPPRAEVDRLVLLYFNNTMLPFILIHAGSFLAQYEKFWKAPHDTPILWVGLLFGIISVASQTEAAWALFSPGVPMSTTQQPLPLSSPFPLLTPPFVNEIAACLILGEYTKGGAYALEALLHYQFIEVTSSPDVHADAWLLSGVVTRLAFRMGYHRDPSHFPSLSPFEGEVRRRIWVIVHCMDTMMSAQMGLPRLIKASSWDTQPPHNLLDSDFGPDCVELPAERPHTETTPALHLLAKHKMFIVIARITDMNMCVVGPDSPPRSLAREREMTKTLFDTHDSLPDKCKFHSMLGCIAESAADIMGRISSSALLQKGLIAIHWRRLMASDAQEEAEQLQQHGATEADRAHIRQSYNMCIHAALRVLNVQSIVETESRPGGALFPLRIQSSSVIKHEFLMSTVVLCRHMYRVAAGPFGSPLLHVVMDSGRDSGDSCGGSIGSSGGPVDGDKVLPEAHIIDTALRHSHILWQRSSAVSTEARRISSILDALFSKLGNVSSSSIKPPIVTSSSLPFDDGTDEADMVDPGLALLDEFGLLHHLQDMNNYFEM